MCTIEVGGCRYELASGGSRLAAVFLDWLGCVGLGLAGILVGMLIGELLAEYFESSLVEAIVYVPSGIAFFLYLFLRNGLPNGQSWGKKTINIKVIHARTGAPCTYFQSFVRELIHQIFGMVLIDYVFMLGKKRQRLGDKTALTVVVKVDSVGIERDEDDMDRVDVERAYGNDSSCAKTRLQKEKG